MQGQPALEKIITPVVMGLGYVLVGLQQFPQGRHSLLRVYIDKPGGVTLEDCERVSRQVDAVLEVESSAEDYSLEVSSPGLDRVLFNEQQILEHLGKKVSIRLKVPILGKRNYQGILQIMQQGSVFIEVDNAKETIEFSFLDIHEIRLVPEW